MLPPDFEAQVSGAVSIKRRIHRNAESTLLSVKAVARKLKLRRAAFFCRRMHSLRVSVQPQSN